MRLALIAFGLCLASAPGCAQAQESAPFYRGKTIERAFALPPEIIAGAREMMAGR
jgi:hypothetical protein